MASEPVPDENLGANIKSYREKRGLTIRDLADRVQTSASLISQIETGRISPSISTLKSISDELGISIGSLFGEEAVSEFEPLMKKKKVKLHHQLAHNVHLFFLSNPGDFKIMEPLLIRYEGEADTGDETFRHPGQEFVTVLKGRIEARLNSKAYVLKRGDCLYFDATIPHSFRNRSKSISESLHVTTPPQFS